MATRLTFSSAAMLAISLVWVPGALPSARAQNGTGVSGAGHPYLFLIRDAVVQKDLGLTDIQKESITQVTDQLDGPLLATRGQSPEKGREVLAQLIAVAESKMREILTEAQQKRLDQITLRTQGIRALVRPEVSRQMTLTAKQIEHIKAKIQETDQAIQTTQKQAREGTSQAALAKQGSELREQEQRSILAILNNDQRKLLVDLAGRPFDASGLGQMRFKSPDISMATAWINSPPLASSDLKGKVVAVHFWAFGCINCIRNYPWYRGWYDSFADDGLVIVGVHTPETQQEREVDRLQKKVKEANFKFPVAVDNKLEIWNTWGNTMWPSVYLIDKQGYIRYWWYGELNWQGAKGEEIMRARIEQLLAER